MFGGSLMLFLGIFVVLGLMKIVLSEIKKNVSKISYDEAVPLLIEEAAAYVTTNNMSESDVYTRDGNIRAGVEKIIAEEAERINHFVNKQESKYYGALKERRLIDANDRIKNRDIDDAAMLLVEHYSEYKKEQRVALFSDGISVAEFNHLRNESQTDPVGVYVLYNVDKDMYYVGQAKKCLFRVNQHFTGHGNGDVYADYKYGDEFKIKIIKFIESGYEDLDKLEKDTINLYDAYNSGYNMTVGNG